jgi:hypothetical protein
LVDKIQGFELKLNDNLGNFTADMKLLPDRLTPNGKSIEFKSWKTGSFNLLNGEQYKNQLKTYMKSGEFEQIFDAQKLIKDGLTTDPDLFVKQKIVDMIKKNAEEFFKSNENYFSKYGIKNAQELAEKINVEHSIILNFKAK